MRPVLAIRDLCVRFGSAAQGVEVVRDFGFDLMPGSTLAIVGASGSGKSQAMLAVMGLLASDGTATGSVKFEGQELLDLGAPALNAIRGSRMTMIFQEPMSALDPLFTIGQQIAAPLRAHGSLGRRAMRARVLELLADVGIGDPAARINSYPHQLSGGQRQRVMIAMAIANHPAVLIADEPTTALDATVQAQVLDLLRDLKTRLHMAMVFVTHDLGLARHIADHVLVMEHGCCVESGATQDIFANPQAAATRALLAASPPLRQARQAAPQVPVLEGQSLQVTLRLPGSFLRRGRALRAVEDVSLSLAPGQTLGIVGESGSGKTTLGRALLRLVPAQGRLLYRGRDLMLLDPRALRPLRKSLQIVFQDPYGSLSPRMTLRAIIGEGLAIHEPLAGKAARERRVIAALEEVGLDAAMANRFPHEFSGGQRQRIAIARVMILRPELVVLDEPTSALDRAIQRDIVALLMRLQRIHGMAYVFISHDLAIVRAMADSVLVMLDGRVVEHGSTEAIFERPRHDATRALLRAAALTQWQSPSGRDAV